MHVSDIIHPLRLVRGRIFYGWWMAALSSLVMAVSTTPLFSGMAVWNPVLRSVFGWTPGQVSWAFAFSRVEGGVLGPVEGFLVDRLGTRRMVLIGLTILGVGFLLFSQIHELWHLYLFFMVMTLGAGLGSWLPMMTALNHWFIRQRSMAMAIAMGGYHVGGIVLIPLLAWAVGAIDGEDLGGDRFGWRVVSAGVGVFIVALAFPLSRLVRNRPEEYGLRPDGDTHGSAPAPVALTEAPQLASDDGDYTWRQAIRTRSFWLITLGHACSSTVIVTVMVHLGLMLDDQGFSLQTIGWVVSTQPGVGVVFNLVGGYAGDRLLPIRIALFGFSAMQAVAVFVLLQAGDSAPMLFLYAVLMGIGLGGRSPLSTAIRGAYFGRRSFASITGISMVPMNVLLFAAPVFAGYVRYDVSFSVIAVVCLLGSCLFLMLGGPRPVSSSPRTETGAR